MKIRSILHAPHLTKLRLGDAVETIAKPIARAIDGATSVLPKSMQTNFKNCGGCAARRAKLNSLAGPAIDVSEKR